MESYRRFILPLLFSVIGIPLTFYVINWLSAGLLFAYGPLDLIPAVDGLSRVDASFLLTLFVPVFLLEFLILVLPTAALMLIFTRVARAATYEIGIYHTAEGFSGMKLLRRAIVPALFALSSGEVFLNLIPEGIFQAPEVDAGTARFILPWFHPLQTILGALIALAVGLAVFMPTWVLNDSGIVSQVKGKQMDSRRCPDTEGVGRWFSNLFGGFAVLAYPITMFHRYFYLAYFVYHRELTLLNILDSLLWTVGIPFLIMSFVTPLVILNEVGLGWIRPRVQAMARRLGAKEVQKESLMLEMTEQVQEHLGADPYDPTKGRTDVQRDEGGTSSQS